MWVVSLKSTELLSCFKLRICLDTSLDHDQGTQHLAEQSPIIATFINSAKDCISFLDVSGVSDRFFHVAFLKLLIKLPHHNLLDLMSSRHQKKVVMLLLSWWRCWKRQWSYFCTCVWEFFTLAIGHRNPDSLEKTAGDYTNAITVPCFLGNNIFHISKHMERKGMKKSSDKLFCSSPPSKSVMMVKNLAPFWLCFLILPQWPPTNFGGK